MKTEKELQTLLAQIPPADVDLVFESEAESFFSDGKMFAKYFRTVIRSKHLTQKKVFETAQIPEHFGYKLIAQEVQTRQRDTLLRLFYSAAFTFEEANTALAIYGLPALYARFPRDAALIAAFNVTWASMDDLNSYLQDLGFDELRPCGGTG